MSINKFLILMLLLCGCASQNITVARNKLMILKLQPEIPNIELKQTTFNFDKCNNSITTNEKELCNLIKQMLIADIENLQIMRKAYNELILNYTIDIEYYNNIYDNQNNSINNK